MDTFTPQSLPPEPGRVFIDLLLKCHLMEKQLAGFAGLSLDELYSLCVLHFRKPDCVKILSSILGIRGTRTSKVLHILERKGLIMRAPSAIDRRKEEVTLTIRGEHLVESIVVQSNAAWQSLFPSLQQEGNRILPDLMDAMAVPRWGVSS
jgi:DNA-binding MarR family transcriptional regulator